MADLRTLTQRVTSLEQAADAQRAATSGIDSSALHEHEYIALCYGLAPAEDGERVARLLSGEAYLVTDSLPGLKPWVAALDPETLERKALGDTARSSLGWLRQRFAEERASLLSTGLYVAPPGDLDLSLILTARCLHRDRCYAGHWGPLERYVEAVRQVMAHKE